VFFVQSEHVMRWGCLSLYIYVSKITKLILVICFGMYTKNFSAYLIFFHTLQETQSEALTLSKMDPYANKWHTE
jgi:hypothetical protein